jgi:uracil-DNA glycosylase family 4
MTAHMLQTLRRNMMTLLQVVLLMCTGIATTVATQENTFILKTKEEVSLIIALLKVGVKTMKVNTISPPGAKIFIVGEAPGEIEDSTGKPFHPASDVGKMLDKLLQNAKLSRYEVTIGYVLKERPPGGSIDFYFLDKSKTVPKPVVLKWVEELRQEIILYKPNIVIGLGEIVLYLLTGEKKIDSNRGYLIDFPLIPEQKLICTYHPQKLNFNPKLGFAAVMDFRKAVLESKSPSFPEEKRALTPRPRLNEFSEYIDYLIKDHKEPIALDIETTPSGHLDILGMAEDQNAAMSFTFVSNKIAVLSPMDEFNLWRKLSDLFKVKSIIMHNGLFDTASMWNFLGILARGYDKDTMIATHVCWPETPRSLSFISSICLNVPKWKHTAADDGALYNCEDAANTYGCWEFFKRELTKGNHWPTFNSEMQQVWPASMLQLQGIKVNREVQKGMITQINTDLDSLKIELTQEFGREVNLQSPKQVQELLYNDMKLPPQYKRRKSRNDKRKVTTDAEALNKLFRTTGNPLLKKILDYKKLKKLLTFVDITVSPNDTVHTSYNITGATMQRKKKGVVIDDEDQYRSFGRWSSSASIILPYGSGNLQNIPKDARKIYTAPPGWKWVQADYMQAEAVVVAYYINDQPMIRLFEESFGLTKEERKNRNLDIHKLTAATNFRIPIAKVTPEQRKIGKVIRHSTNYSAGPAVLANKIGCKLSEAKTLLSNFHNTCPQLHIWHRSIEQELRKSRSLTNIFGRVHKFLGHWDDNLFRSAYSFKPQSSIGDLLNRALVRLYNNYGKELHIALQLHDAIYCLVPEELVDWTCTVMRQCMLIPLELNGKKFYIDIDFTVGDSWGEMDDYTPNFTHLIKVGNNE